MKTNWVSTSVATTYVPREKPIQESVAPFSGTISGAAPATTSLGSNTGQRILASDGTWIPQPAFTSGGADAIQTLRPSAISTSYSANPPTVTNSAYSYDVDTNHATTFGQWTASSEARTNNRVDVFTLTTWGAKTETWTAATINVSRSYADLSDGESSATSGASSKTSSVLYEFSTNNGSSYTALGTDTQTSVPTAPQTLQASLGTLSPTMGNIIVRVTITRGGGGTIYEDGVSIPGLTGSVDLKLFDVWIDGTYAGGSGNITCNNLTVNGDATLKNKLYDSTTSAGSVGQVLKVASSGKVEWQTDSTGSGTVTSITTTGANGVTVSGGSTQTITTSGTFALALGNITPTSITTGAGSFSTGAFSGDVEFSSSIKSPNGSNSPVVIAPDGTGDLHVNADSLRLGDNNADATIQTRGTGDLIITTNEGSANEGIIRLYDGANGNIRLTPNGTGQVQIGTDQVVTLTASQTLTNKTISGSSNTLSNIANASLTNSTISGVALGSSLNALTISSPLTGTSYNGSSAVSIGIPVATTSVSGYLSSTDWTTFNNKGSGTITSVTATSPVASSGGTTPAISLSAGYGDTLNPYASKTANYFLSAPNGSAGVPSFRAILPADIPTLNQNTTGDAGSVNNITAVNLFNNMGQVHTTRSSFDASTPSYGFGFRYVQGTTNGPATGGGTQFYSWYIGLGSEYGSTGSGSYGMYIAIPRNATTPYLSIRYNESNSLGSWIKIASGYSDTSGSATNVTGTVAVANGGTGLTSLTANRIPYGNGTSAFQSSSGLTFDGTNFATTGDISLSAGKLLKYSSTAYITPENNVSGAEISTTGVITFKAGSGATERMRLDASGNLGIGTTTPSTGTLNRQLTINSGATNYAGVVLQNNATGTAYNNGTYLATLNGTDSILLNCQAGYLSFGTNNLERMRLDASGNLGIGTSSPSAKLHSYTTSSANVLMLENSNNAGIYARWKRPNKEYYLALDINNNGGKEFTLYDATANAIRMTVTDSGDVGIGTTSPSNKLQVNGLMVGNNATGSYSKGFGGIQTTTSTSTPTGGSSGDFVFIY